MAEKQTWSFEELDQLKDEVIALIKEYGLWMDTAIYVNGRRYRYASDAPDQVLVEDDMDPSDYFEYTRREGNIFAMSFEGPLYLVLNDYVAGYDDFREKFDSLFARYGLFYEFGDAWNLSCYPDPAIS